MNSKWFWIILCVLLFAGYVARDQLGKKKKQPAPVEKPTPQPEKVEPEATPVVSMVSNIVSTAMTFYVSSSGDDNNNGETWASAKASIQAAVNVAPAGGEIIVTNGTYALNAPINVEKKLILRSVNGATNTIVDGNNAVRCFCLNKANIVLDGFTIRGGSTQNSSDDSPRSGGGVLVNSAGCLVRNSVVSDNNAADNGGGMYFEAPGVVANCVFSGNKSGNDGGGVGNFSGSMSNCILRGNSVEGHGGGIQIKGGIVYNCILQGNKAGVSGGGAASVFRQESDRIVSDCIRNCLITGNSAGESGGGVRNAGRIENCTIVGNTAQSGGGVYNVCQEGGPEDKEPSGGVVVNSIVCGNKAGEGNNYYNAGYDKKSAFSFSCTLPPAVGAGNLAVPEDRLFVKRGTGVGAEFSAGDFRLISNSPCINAGTNLDWMTNAVDLKGNARIFNGIADIGAYEFMGKKTTVPFKAEMQVTVFYVSTKGNDAWTGKLPDPNAGKTDGPFLTLVRARDAVRELKQAADGQLLQPVEINIRGGVYYLSDAFILAEADSGTAEHPVVYKAYNREDARLSGGRMVAGFQMISNTAVMMKLDPAARTKILQTNLRAQNVTEIDDVVGKQRVEVFFQDRPMTLARWPNQGFTYIAKVVGGEPCEIHGKKGDKIGKFAYNGDRPKKWIGAPDIYLHGYWFWDWADERHKVDSIDPAKRIITVVQPYHYYGYRQGQWYYAFNILAELDAPGEWYLDQATGTLYFWPPAPINSGQVVVSYLSTLVSIKNVSFVTFGEGLTLEAARDTVLSVSGGENVRISGCVIRNSGGNAVAVSGISNGVDGCHIYEVGGGGISLTGGDRKSLTPAGLYADNNHIHNYGRWTRMYSPAVALNGVGNRAAHNLIHDAPHQAISFGGNDHVIEFNEIYNVCTEANDAGAIYSGRDWTMRGTIIRYNFLHNLSGFKNSGCTGVYLDDMFCGTTVFGNTFYKVNLAILLGGGRDNIVENNVFVDCPFSVHLDARALGWAAESVAKDMIPALQKMPYKQPPWSERYPKLVNILDEEPAAPKGNVVARNIWKGSQSDKWEEVEEKARPGIIFKDNLLNRNPGFVNAARMNFQIKAHSSVYNHGFQPVPFDEIGPRKATNGVGVNRDTGEQRPDPSRASGSSNKLSRTSDPAP